MSSHMSRAEQIAMVERLSDEQLAAIVADPTNIPADILNAPTGDYCGMFRNVACEALQARLIGHRESLLSADVGFEELTAASDNTILGIDDGMPSPAADPLDSIADADGLDSDDDDVIDEDDTGEFDDEEETAAA